MPLGLLIPLLSPLVTELIKVLTAKFIPDSLAKDVPPAMTPVVAAAAGGAIAALAPFAGLQPNVDVLTGAELGLAGVGVNQFVRLAGTSRATNAVWLLIMGAAAASL